MARRTAKERAVAHVNRALNALTELGKVKGLEQPQVDRITATLRPALDTALQRIAPGGPGHPRFTLDAPPPADGAKA